MLATSLWKNFDQFSNEKLVNLVHKMPDFLKKSKSKNTIAAYTYAYKQFEDWCTEFEEITSFPTDEYAVSLYLMTLVQQEKSISFVRQFTASASWTHELGGYENPIASPIVQTILQSTIRQLANPRCIKIQFPKTC